MQLLDLAYPKGAREPALKKLLKVRLYPYQVEGALFAARAGRALIGDEMGLGKTVQAIAAMELLARDMDLIDAWAPDLVIVDEAQRIKNWNTVAARALKRIDSAYAIVLTGTPLENRLEELISIVQFVDQHRLGPTWRLLHEHQERDEHGRVIGYRNLDRIGHAAGGRARRSGGQGSGVQPVAAHP
jgi:SNF2 family DNA or RNA helicase